jgi:hypothetical protein
MKTLAEESWSHTLFDRNGEIILSVVCGGAAIYEFNVRLTEEEIGRVVGNEVELDALAKAIRDNNSAYLDRQVKL